MSLMYDRIWVALEIYHDMDPDADGRALAAARSIIIDRLNAGDADARLACVEFADACFIANIPFDLDYDLD